MFGIKTTAGKRTERRRITRGMSVGVGRLCVSVRVVLLSGCLLLSGCMLLSGCTLPGKGMPGGEMSLMLFSEKEISEEEGDTTAVEQNSMSESDSEGETQSKSGFNQKADSSEEADFDEKPETDGEPKADGEIETNGEPETAGESEADQESDFDSIVSGGSAAYQTDTVKRGHFSRSSSFEGVVYYPELSPVVYEGEQAVLTEWLVEQGSEVKKGDPVASIQIEYDEVALKEQELALERLESDYEWQREQMEKALEEKRKLVAGASSQSREALEYRKAEKELELYDLSMGQRVEAQQKSVQEFQERIAVTTITAPIDGVVSELSYLKSGDYLPQGESLMVLYNPEVVWLQVTDPNATLRYNMEVRIETGPPKSRTTLSGRVIAADNILPDALRKGLAYIELSELPTDIKWNNTSIRADLVSMDEVLLISRLAVESSTGGTFVYVVEDGSLHKRQVIRAGQGTESSWILMGLTEGQEVVIP